MFLAKVAPQTLSIDVSFRVNYVYLCLLKLFRFAPLNNTCIVLFQLTRVFQSNFYIIDITINYVYLYLMNLGWKNM